jgi:hypothetical protein
MKTRQAKCATNIFVNTDNHHANYPDSPRACPATGNAI